MPIDRTNVSIYLLKRAKIAEFKATLLDVGDVPISLIPDLDGVFLPLITPAHPPDWVGPVRNVVQNPAAINLVAQNAGGLMVIYRNSEAFVLSFGHAWLRLKPEWLEHDFGRKVALNAIAKDQLLEISAEQVFAKWHLARERAPKAASLHEFGVESERDLVSAVEGVPSDETLGPILRGGTSVRIKIPLNTLANILDRITALYKSKHGEKEWPELHNLIPILDAELTSKLDARLDGDLAAGRGASDVILFAPSLRREDYQPAQSYVFGRFTKTSPSAPYLMFGSWESALLARGQSPSVKAAREMPVHLLDDAREEMAVCRVYECLGYETALAGRQYILSSGIWYEAGANFVATINAKVESLPAPPTELMLWDGVCTEGEYNKKCASRDKTLIHFDAKNVMFGGGHSQFEFCDLLHPGSRVIYFVKIASRSSDFSHLTEQTRRTLELLFTPDDAFRRELKRKVKKVYPRINTRWLDERPRPGDWNLCLVSLGRSAETLPFFAKCGLVRLVRDLEARGHTISFLSA